MLRTPLICFLSILPAATSYAAPCDEVHSPFKASNRRSLKALNKRVISVFGDYRASYVKGHKHAGLDLKGRPSEPIYAICAGRIVDVHLAFPHLTVVVEHQLEDNRKVYSSYKHIEDLEVDIGDEVDEHTVLGRLFTKSEQKKARFQVIHLHFEIRKNLKDGGAASWSAMTMKQLNQFCLDPLLFMKRHLAP